MCFARSIKEGRARARRERASAATHCDRPKGGGGGGRGSSKSNVGLGLRLWVFCLSKRVKIGPGRRKRRRRRWGAKKEGKSSKPKSHWAAGARWTAPAHLPSLAGRDGRWENGLPCGASTRTHADTSCSSSPSSPPPCPPPPPPPICVAKLDTRMMAAPATPVGPNRSPKKRQLSDAPTSGSSE